MGSAVEVPIRGFGGGLAAADFDNDADVDLFVPTKEGTPHLLYRNLGNGTFEEVAGTLGVASTERGRTGLWLDADGDGLLDLLVAGDCFESPELCNTATFLRLFRQTKGGSFVDVTAAAGLSAPGATDVQHRSGLAAGDVNGDGLLDFVSAFWGAALKLHLNQGDGTFLEASATTGILDDVLAYHQPVMVDLNQDGLLDIYSSVDFTENRLWLNQGNDEFGSPIFLESANLAGCDSAWNDMGVAVGDVDEDGDPDLYITNIHREGRHNILLQNDLEASTGTLSFSEISSISWTQDVDGWGWGATFLDLDNDGLLDLAATNGWHTPTWDKPARLFHNLGTSVPSFSDLAASAGLTGESWGSTLLSMDLDRDGDLDLLEAISKSATPGPRNRIDIYQNQQQQRGAVSRYLNVLPRMGGSNPQAIGAKVSATFQGKTSHRFITAGSSYLGQHPAEAFFGLGTAAIVDLLLVNWPSGPVSELRGVAADQLLTVNDSFVFHDSFESGSALWD